MHIPGNYHTRNSKETFPHYQPNNLISPVIRLPNQRSRQFKDQYTRSTGCYPNECVTIIKQYARPVLPGNSHEPSSGLKITSLGRPHQRTSRFNPRALEKRSNKFQYRRQIKIPREKKIHKRTTSSSKPLKSSLRRGAPSGRRPRQGRRRRGARIAGDRAEDLETHAKVPSPDKTYRLPRTRSQTLLSIAPRFRAAAVAAAPFRCRP